jgi:hypothetical protein
MNKRTFSRQNQCGKHANNRIRLSFATAAGLILVFATASSARAQTLNSGIIDPTSTYEGKTYGDWSAAHWQWVYSLPRDKHPLFDTGNVSVGQTGDVWFLGGAYTTIADTNGVINGTAVRDCTIPQGKSLFFPLIDAESSTAEGNGSTYAELSAHAKAQIDAMNKLSCTIDGQTVSNLTSYRAASDLFTWGPLPTNNVFGDPVNFPAGTTSQAAADGYYLLLQPLTPGSHSIHFTGGVPGFLLDITYNLVITPTNGVYPPGSIMFGKTYGQWAGAFFQYYYGLPSTNNPFYYDAAHPNVPLGTGQSGPVWFVHGYRNVGGTNSRNDTIPAGTSLALVVLDLHYDNADCPNPDHFTPAQLESFLAPDVNGASNMTMRVDGVSLADISDVLTTPFRVQTVYDFTSPAFDNMIYWEEGLTCYQNNQGIPYTVTGAVADGVLLMVPPLSPGSHTIKYTLSFPGDVLGWNMTENVTVPPVTPPTLSVSEQNGMLNLTWPQIATDYEVETASSLDSSDWEPANLPVSTTEGIFQVSAPIGGSPQFFRLHRH